jgi:hypothetical protein
MSDNLPLKMDNGNQAQLVEQLVMLREHTERFGTVHEAQILQLKVLPRVLVPNSTKSEARLDTDKKEVEIRVTTKGKAHKKQAQLTKQLGEGIQWVLGGTWKCSVFIDDKAPMVFPRTAKAKKDKYQGTDFEAGKIVPEKVWRF